MKIQIYFVQYITKSGELLKNLTLICSLYTQLHSSFGLLVLTMDINSNSLGFLSEANYSDLVQYLIK